MFCCTFSIVSVKLPFFAFTTRTNHLHRSPPGRIIKLATTDSPIVATQMSVPQQQHSLPASTRTFAVQVQGYVQYTANTQEDVCVETLELKDALLGFIEFFIRNPASRPLARALKSPESLSALALVGRRRLVRDPDATPTSAEIEQTSSQPNKNEEQKRGRPRKEVGL
jgi:hypothetical protein